MFDEKAQAAHKKAVSFGVLMNQHVSGVFAGGCARDVLMGQAPKDYDFILLTDHSAGDMICLIQKVYTEAYGILEDASVSVDAVHEESYDGAPAEQEIEFAIKLTFCGVSIDIIKPVRPNGESIGVLEAIESFDFPMNQFAFTRGGSNIVGNGHLQVAQHANRKLRDGRLSYMQQKFPDYEFYDLH